MVELLSETAQLQMLICLARNHPSATFLPASLGATLNASLKLTLKDLKQRGLAEYVVMPYRNEPPPLPSKLFITTAGLELVGEKRSRSFGVNRR